MNPDSFHMPTNILIQNCILCNVSFYDPTKTSKMCEKCLHYGEIVNISEI